MTKPGSRLAGMETGMKPTLAAAAAVLLLLVGCSAAPASVVTVTPPPTSSAPSPAEEPSETPSENPGTVAADATLGELLTKDDFTVEVKVLSKKCFGSAGCNVEFRIRPGYHGTYGLPKSGEVEVTYEVKGGDDPLTNTFTIDGEGTASFSKSESISTPSSKAKLKAVVTDVAWSEG